MGAGGGGTTGGEGSHGTLRPCSIASLQLMCSSEKEVAEAFGGFPTSDVFGEARGQLVCSRVQRVTSLGMDGG